MYRFMNNSMKMNKILLTCSLAAALGLSASCGSKNADSTTAAQADTIDSVSDSGAVEAEDPFPEVKPFTIGLILEKGNSNKEMPAFRKLSQVKDELTDMGYTFEHIKKGKTIIVPDEDGDAMKVKADVDRFTLDGTTVEYATTPEKDEWHITFVDKEELNAFLDNAKDLGFKALEPTLYNWQGDGKYSFLWIAVEGKTAIIGYGE